MTIPSGETEHCMYLNKEGFVNETVPVNTSIRTQRKSFKSDIQGYNTGNLQQVIKHKAQAQTALKLSKR